MADIKKVIKGLQIERECVSRDCDRNCGQCDLVQDRDWLLSVYDDALALLKEQEAVEPEVEVLNEIDKLYRCPKCHKHFFYEKQKYCDKCGQAVKWE